MDYEQFLDNYSAHLQLMDALDALTRLDPDAAETLEHLVSHSNNEKTSLKLLQTDQTGSSSSPDTQLL